MTAVQLLQASFRPRTRASVPDHRHANWELHYVADGRCGFRVGRRRLRLAAGDIFLIPPRTVHGVDISAGGEWLLQYIVHLGVGRSDAPLLRRLGGGVHHVGSAVQGLFATLAERSTAGDPWRRQAAWHRLLALLHDCAGGLADHPHEHPAVAAALDLMRRNLRRGVGPAELAAAASCTPAHLSRLFRRAIGVPPLRHFRHLQMEAAAAELAAGAGVTATAAALGFADPFHFSRCFRRWAGRPPSRARTIPVVGRRGPVG